jgi:hypothetical protein
MNEKPSPLEEASTESLDELFSRDPLQLAEEDIAKIVTRLRAERAKWDIEQAEAAAKPPRAKAGTAAKAPKVAKVIADDNLSLDDLGL